MGSSGGGNYKAPATQTPAGPIAPYGQSTAPGPTAMGVLPSSGDPMTMEMMAQAWANPQWSTPPPPPPSPTDGSAGTPIGLDAFAKSLMDWRRGQVGLAGRRGMPQWNTMPQAQGPTQQLMAAGMRNDLAGLIQARNQREHNMTLGSGRGGRSGGHSQR